MAEAPTARIHANKIVGGAGMEVMQPYRHSEVIPEVKGVQAFPPAYFNNKQKKMEGKTKK